MRGDDWFSSVADWVFSAVLWAVFVAVLVLIFGS